MTSRYQELYRLGHNLYIEGSPVLIEAGALQKDIVSDRVLAQIKIKNLADKRVIACKVCIRAYETSGNEIEGISSFSYLDIVIKQGQDFGSKTPIYLPDNTTRRFDVAVIEVVFDDNTVWTQEPSEWIPLPTQKKVLQVLNDLELVRQYGMEVGSDSSYYPELVRGLFLCTCGTVNMGGGEMPCYKCNRKYVDLVKIIDSESLSLKRDERVKKEEENRRIEREREEERKAEAAKIAAQRKVEEERIAEITRKQRILKAKKIKKILCIAVPIAILIIILYPSKIKPAIDKASSYKTAVELLENGEYDEASRIFNSLGEYRDSKLMANESQYRKADEYYSKGYYETAIDVWKSIAQYSDSTERITAAEKEDDYQEACVLLKQKKYVEASKAFDLLGEYKDAKEKSSDCIEQKKNDDYLLGCQLLDDKKYKLAIDQFNHCGDYKDAESKISEAKYGYVNEHRNNSDSTTFFYLRDLVKDNYMDASDIYNNLYKVKVIDVWFNSKIHSRVSSISRYDPVSCYFLFFGGAPVESYNIVYYIEIIYPDGEKSKEKYETTVYKTHSGNPRRREEYVWENGISSSGILTVNIYDEQGDKMGSGSVRVN